jgi:exonuclease III
VNEWDQDFQKYLTKLKEDKKKPLILTGDLNVAHHEIDIYDPKGKDKVACFTP